MRVFKESRCIWLRLYSRLFGLKIRSLGDISFHWLTTVGHVRQHNADVCSPVHEAGGLYLSRMTVCLPKIHFFEYSVHVNKRNLEYILKYVKVRVGAEVVAQGGRQTWLLSHITCLTVEAWVAPWQGSQTAQSHFWWNLCCSSRVQII